MDTDIDLNMLFKDKIILIGDVCENDIHDTYLGKVAGPVINLNAYYALANDDLSIAYAEIILLFLIYFGISFSIIKRYTILNLIPYFKRFKSKTFLFFLSFLSLSILFSVIGVFGYIIMGMEVNILVPSLYFTLFGYIVRYYYIHIEK